MWRFTISTNPKVQYGYISPAAAQFEGLETQYYYYNYSFHLTLNSRYGSLTIL